MDRDVDSPHFKSAITFSEIDGKTEINMRMLFPSAETREETAEFGAVKGGQQTLSRFG